jgi:hypothetical protein
MPRQCSENHILIWGRPARQAVQLTPDSILHGTTWKMIAVGWVIGEDRSTTGQFRLPF